MQLEVSEKYSGYVDGIKEDAKKAILITPPLDEDYWLFRVKLFKDQSLVAFPKFLTVGIGFAIEDGSWNTNLPFMCEPEEILSHIWLNHKYKEITKTQALEAIKMLQKAAKEFKEKEMEVEKMVGKKKAEMKVPAPTSEEEKEIDDMATQIVSHMKPKKGKKQ